MRLLLQRVKSAQVLSHEKVTAGIGRGLVIFLGVGSQDTPEQVDFLAEKVANLRVFEDEHGKTNRSIQEVGGEVALVSQFTLYADTRKGRRPSFIEAAPPQVAEPLVDRFADTLRRLQVPTQTGSFGAHMLVRLENDGPFTLWLEK